MVRATLTLTLALTQYEFMQRAPYMNATEPTWDEQGLLLYRRSGTAAFRVSVMGSSRLWSGLYHARVLRPKAFGWVLLQQLGLLLLSLGRVSAAPFRLGARLLSAAAAYVLGGGGGGGGGAGGGTPATASAPTALAVGAASSASSPSAVAPVAAAPTACLRREGEYEGEYEAVFPLPPAGQPWADYEVRPAQS